MLPRWFQVSLLHPLASLALLCVAFLPAWTGLSTVAYLAVLVAALLNFPGVSLTRGVLSWFGPGNTDQHILPLVAFSILLTWILIVIPICWLAAQFIRRRRAIHQDMGADTPCQTLPPERH